MRLGAAQEQLFIETSLKRVTGMARLMIVAVQ